MPPDPLLDEYREIINDYLTSQHLRVKFLKWVTDTNRSKQAIGLYYGGHTDLSTQLSYIDFFHIWLIRTHRRNEFFRYSTDYCVAVGREVQKKYGTIFGPDPINQ